MARFHVNPHTGNAGECSAKISCPYGNLESDHFDSAADARAAYEAGNLDNAFATLSKATDEVVNNAFESANDYPAPDERPIADRIAARAARDEAIMEQAIEAGYTSSQISSLHNPNRIHPALPVYMDMDREALELEHDKLLDGEISDSTPAHFRSSYRELSALSAIALDLKKLEDQAVLDGAAKAGWPIFDPSKGADQFDNGAGEYHANGTDEPALTDEAMDEMSRNMEAAARPRTVNYWEVDEDEEGRAVYRVEVSGYGSFPTGDLKVVHAAERVSAAGEWDEIELWDEAPENKLKKVSTYLEHPGGEAFRTARRAENEAALASLGDADDLSSSSKRFHLRLDNELLAISERVLASENFVGRRGSASSTDTPPF